MITDFLKDYEYYTDVDLKKYNTYRISSIAKFLIFPRTIEELIALLKYLKENNLSYLLLGNGSNVILASNSYEVVIKLDRFNSVQVVDDTIKVEAGYPLISLSSLAANNNLSGLEFAFGIPGLTGASIAINAGAYNQDFSEIVETVTVIDNNFKIKVMTADDLDFSYRHSFLKDNPSYICISATLKLQPKPKEEIMALMMDRKRRRLLSQPLELPSAGSVFRNPKDLHAGALIEQAGLKNYHINGAYVSEKHANFIVNKKDATASDIIALINHVKKVVKEKYKIDLILEQEIKR